MSTVDALQFLDGAPLRLRRFMQTLSAAESLTDDVARRLLAVQGISEASADTFLELLHCADYIVPRNSEWHFTADVRTALRQSVREDKVPLEDVHTLLLEIGRTGNRAAAGDLIPAYLFTRAGMAYHRGELGFSEEALQEYARVANVSDNGELWLAGSLSQEQQRMGTLAADAIEPTFLRALSAYRDHDKDRAYPNLLSVAESGKPNELVAWAMQLAGEIDMQRGHLDAALDRLNQAVDLFETLKSWNKCIWALALRAEILRKIGSHLDALKDLRRAISMCDGDWRARLLCRVGVIEHERNRFDKAMAALDEAEEHAHSVHAIVLIQRAGLKRERGDPAGALRDLDRAVAISRQNRRSIALNTRATVHWELGQWKEAREDLDLALRVAHPENRAVILNTRSCVKRDEGDFIGSLTDNRTIGELPPRLRRSIKMDLIQARSRGVQKALEALHRAQAENDSDRFWFKHFFSMARASMQVRAWYRAVKLMQRALEFAHTDAERAKCLRSIGLAYEKTIDGKMQAIEPLQRAIELVPEDSAALATIGRVLDGQGRPLVEVEPYFLRAIKADPGNEWARSWYALALSRAGRHEEAIPYAEGALGDPPHAVRLFNLALVLDASPEPNNRLRALLFAQQAEKVAQPGFDEPMIFLEKYGFS